MKQNVLAHLRNNVKIMNNFELFIKRFFIVKNKRNNRAIHWTIHVTV